MPIVSIIQEPGSPSLPKVYAAYRPIIFKIAATGTVNGLVVRGPRVVYCDIYFNDVFYKTLSATQWYYVDYTNTRWEFDISASAQEYLKYNVPTNGGTTIDPAIASVVSAYCKFRSSGTDANGFIVPEGPQPRQATGTLAAAGGGGTQSESFQIINAVLQHEDNQDLQTHLQYARPNVNFEANTYPLTHRPNGYKVCKTDSDHYPFLHLGNKTFSKITVTKTFKSGSTNTANYSVPQTCSSVVSDLQAVVQSNNDVQVDFSSSGSAQEWQWTINGGTNWVSVFNKSFVISLDDIAQILITEAGEAIITEDGKVIVPEGLEIFKDYELTVRPRCINGATGTSATTTYTIEEAGVCPVPTSFFSASKNYTNKTITFSVGMPSGEIAAQLEWQFDYGNGFISNSSFEDYASIPSTFIWNAPPMADNGTYKVRIRTKCDTDDYSAWTSWVNVVWNKPVNTVQVYLSPIFESGGMWQLQANLSAAVISDVLVQGYFQGDNALGTLQGFSFYVTIPAGQTHGLTSIGNAESGGHAINTKIVFVNPTTLSDGTKLSY